MSTNQISNLPVLPIDQYPIGSWYIQTAEDGCKIPYVRLCAGTDEDWCPLQKLLKLENDPAKSCCTELDCNCLNIPTSFIWKRTDESVEQQLYVPRNVMTPIPLGLTIGDTPQGGGHGDGLCIPCDGLWGVESTLVVTHPLDEAAPGLPWSEDALFGLFTGNGPGQSNPGFLRQYTNSWSQDGLYYATILVQREIPIRAGACYYNYLFWEDVSSVTPTMVQIASSTLKATFNGKMPDSYDGLWAT